MLNRYFLNLDEQSVQAVLAMKELVAGKEVFHLQSRGISSFSIVLPAPEVHRLLIVSTHLIILMPQY